MRNVRENADRSHRPGGPQARQKSVPKGRAASSGTELFTGVWGAATNKQNERLAVRRGVHFLHDGTIVHCLPVSTPFLCVLVLAQQD